MTANNKAAARNFIFHLDARKVKGKIKRAERFGILTRLVFILFGPVS